MTALRESKASTSTETMSSRIGSIDESGIRLFQLIGLLFLSIILSSCGCAEAILQELQTVGQYETDTNANMFLTDADCCGIVTESVNEPQPLSNEIMTVFPIGSSSGALFNYITEWGGDCIEEQLAEFSCTYIAEIFRPTWVSNFTVYRQNYIVSWTGFPMIEEYLEITRSYLRSGHLPESEWRNRAELQRLFIEEQSGGET